MTLPDERLGPSTAVADCYSGGERAWMERTQAVRGTLLDPLLRALESARVTPDHVTLLSLVCGLACAPLLFVSAPLALVGLALHVVLDGIDGPLARHTGVASRRGSFTDTSADQAVITTTTIGLMVGGWVGPVAGTLYVYLYAVVVAIAMARNALGVPFSWLVRPRLVVYAWIPVELYGWPGTLGTVHGLGATVLGLKMLSGIARLRRRL